MDTNIIMIMEKIRRYTQGVSLARKQFSPAPFCYVILEGADPDNIGQGLWI